MSTCISTHGDYSSHIPDPDYLCTRCGVLDEDALIAELNHARGELARVQSLADMMGANVDALEAEVARLTVERDEAHRGRLTAETASVNAASREQWSRMKLSDAESKLARQQPVIEAANAWRSDGSDPSVIALIAAVDAFEAGAP